MALVRLDSKYGFAFVADNRIIAPIYTKAQNFSEGLAAVMQGDKWGYINMDSNMVIAPEYDGARDFNNGSAYVEINGEGGLIDMCGNRINEFDHVDRDYDYSYEDNPSMYDCSIRTFHGYVNRQGEYAVKPKFQEARAFHNGLAIVKIDNKYGIIDKTGTYIVEPQFDEDNFNLGIDIRIEYSGASKTANMALSTIRVVLSLNPSMTVEGDSGMGWHRYVSMINGVLSAPKVI